MAAYPTGIKIFIDEEDVTEAIFGTTEITISDVNRIFNNLDITSYVKFPGQHTLKITSQGGIGRVDARIVTK